MATPTSASSPNITYSVNRGYIRQSIGKMISSRSSYAIYTGGMDSATAGATTATISISKFKAVPPGDSTIYVGSLLYITEGTGASSQPYYVTAFSPGVLTVTPSWTNGTPEYTTSKIEIYPSGGFSRDEIEWAIDTAYIDGASRLLWPTEEVAVAFESQNAPSLTGPVSSQLSNNFRTEYPIPTQFSWLTRIDYDQNNPVMGYGPYNCDFVTLGPPGGLSQLQSFTVTSPTLVSAVSMYLARPSANTSNMNYIRATIGTVTGSQYSVGAYSEPRLIADVPTRPEMFVFEFLYPILLQPGTTYWLELGVINADGTYIAAPSGSSGVYWFGDSKAGYGKATGVNNPLISNGFINQGITYSLIFYLYSDPQFKPMPHNAWSIITGDDIEMIHFDTAVIGQPEDGTLIRLIGARPPNDFLTPTVVDTDIPEVEPAFLIYKAASILMMNRLLEPGVSIDAMQAKADLWGKQSEQHRQPFVLPPGAARRVR